MKKRPGRSAWTSVEADVYSRHASSSTFGRGIDAGWTRCPLCCGGFNSAGQNGSCKEMQKLYVLGRGISAHLNDVHTPWNPKKKELQRRLRVRRMVRLSLSNQANAEPSLEDEILKKELGHDIWDRMGGEGEDRGPGRPLTWEPTTDERAAWSQKVLELTTLVQQQYQSFSTSTANKRIKVNPPIDTMKHTVVTTNRNVKYNSDKELPFHNAAKQHFFISAGHDRNGNMVASSYRESLPPFLKAAADGNLDTLKDLCDRTTIYNGSEASGDALQDDSISLNQLWALINTRDRNGATAEHWAAGGGHLRCLQYLFYLRYDRCICMHRCSLSSNCDYHTSNETTMSENGQQKKYFTADGEKDTSSINSSPSTKQIEESTSSSGKRLRRRDGKTCLHYAARNGHNHVIDYLLSPSIPSTSASSSTYTRFFPPTNVDVTSGDGTTPLHLACFKGHFHTVRHLVENYNADISAVNDWGCGVGHWVAMSSMSSENMSSCIRRSYEGTIDVTDGGVYSVLALCNYIWKMGGGAMFCTRQKQGHSAVHKACHRLNRPVLEWLISMSKDLFFTREEKILAGLPDSGGNRPSDIWCKVGGDIEVAKYLRTECNW